MPEHDIRARGTLTPMRLAALIVLALVFAVAAPAATTAPTLVGHVSVVSGELQCTTACGVPAAPVVLRFTKAGGVVRLVKTDAKGALRAWLPAGTYSVAAPAYRNAGLTPTHVVLTKAATKKVAFIIRVARA